jgi:hypothetical protein
VVWPPYQVALRLYFIASEHWAVIDGENPGIDLIKLPAYRFLNFIYAWSLNRIEPDRREEWIHMLNAPLSGSESEPSEYEVEAEGDMFMAAMGTLKARG